LGVLHHRPGQCFAELGRSRQPKAEEPSVPAIYDRKITGTKQNEPIFYKVIQTNEQTDEAEVIKCKQNDKQRRGRYGRYNQGRFNAKQNPKNPNPIVMVPTVRHDSRVA
jgi:hypothetical protein